MGKKKLLTKQEREENKRRRERDKKRRQRARKRDPDAPMHGNRLEVRDDPVKKRAIAREKATLAQRRYRSKKKLVKLMKSLRAPTFRLATEDEMKKIRSWFVLKANVAEYVLHLARMELYLTKDVSIHRHGRHIEGGKGKNGEISKVWVMVDDDKHVEIRAEEEEYLDYDRDLLHVVRPGSSIVQDLNRKYNIQKDGDLPDFFNPAIIINALNLVGKGDDTRSPDSRRLTLSFNCRGHRMGFRKIKEDLLKEIKRKFGRGDEQLGEQAAKEFLQQVGRMAEYLCDFMITAHDEAGNGGKLFPDEERDRFAAELRELLYLNNNSPMYAEMIGVCVMRITGIPSRNFEHIDIMNPEEEGYNRSSTFNYTVTGEDGHLYLLQIIVSSRRYARTIAAKGYIQQNYK